MRGNSRKQKKEFLIPSPYQAPSDAPPPISTILEGGGGLIELDVGGGDDKFKCAGTFQGFFKVNLSVQNRTNRQYEIESFLFYSTEVERHFINPLIYGNVRPFASSHFWNIFQEKGK